MKKQHWKSSEQKRNHELLSQQWEKLQREYERISPKKVSKPISKSTLRDPFASNLAYRSRSHRDIPSMQDSTGIAPKKEVNTYSGTAMLGVATLHKSNAIPVFSTAEAKDMATMRR